MAVKKTGELVTATGEAIVGLAEASTGAAVDAAAAAVPSNEQATPRLMLAAPTVKTQTEVKVTMEKAMKTAEEMVSFGQGNMEAFVKAGQIWAAGVQDMGKQFAATAQAHIDQTVATMKALATVKSLKEAMDLQSSLARTSLEKAVADTGKLTDASLKLTEQAMAPITARVTLAMEKFGRAA